MSSIPSGSSVMDSPSMEKVSCALCGSEDYSVLLEAEDCRFPKKGERFCVVQCRQCGLLFVNPRPTKGELSRFYPRDYYCAGSETLRALPKPKVKRLMRARRSGRILDLGCGDGGFLLQFKRIGWDVYAVDVSEKACALASMKLGRNVFNCELKDCRFPESFFDVVTANHVFEHLLDPNEELREVHRILKHDGIVSMGIPNIDCMQFRVCRESWLGLDLPRHICHYSPRTAQEILEKNGFRVVSIRYPVSGMNLMLFRSLRGKYLAKRSRLLEILLRPLLLSASILYVVPKWRPTMDVLARKE